VLSACGGRIGDAVVAGPTPEAYDALANKAALLARAQTLGWPIPRTIQVACPSELIEAAQAVGYPCVLKPHRSVVADGVLNHSFGVRYATGPAALQDAYPAAAYPLLVQERIAGPIEGVFLLMEHGRRVAVFAHRRLREKPPSGGVSTYRESIPVVPELLAATERLLGDVGWHGVAMVEFKRSDRNGLRYLMEVNGRLWGSLQLAIDAGVDFPNLLVAVALGRPVTAVETYRVGVRSRWFWGDVDHLLTRLRRSPAALRLGPEAPSLLRTAWEFVQFWRNGDRLEVWDRHDMRPFWRETLDWCRGRGT
jgi:predicted ATP-grasp superfamily ATP-dependent carboligase